MVITRATHLLRTFCVHAMEIDSLQKMVCEFVVILQGTDVMRYDMDSIVERSYISYCTHVHALTVERYDDNVSWLNHFYLFSIF